MKTGTLTRRSVRKRVKQNRAAKRRLTWGRRRMQLSCERKWRGVYMPRFYGGELV